MHHGRQNRAQQELGIVESWIGQDVFLRHQSGARIRMVADRWMRGCHGGAGGLQGGVDCLSRIAPGREELRVEEGDRARRATGQQILAEVGRQIDRRNGAPGADRRCRGAEVIGAARHRNARRGSKGLHEQLRGRRVVHVDDNDIEPADHRRAERKAEYHEGDHRHAEQQEPRRRVAQDPAHLPRRDGEQTRLRRCHECCPCQSV